MFLLSKVSSKQIFSWHGLTMLSDRRYWNPYNFPRLSGYRSKFITIVKLGSVLKQLQVAMSLLFSVFARGGVAWFYNIFNKVQNLIISPHKKSEVFSKKPKFIKAGIQIFSWHPGSLSNHKFLAFHTNRKLEELFDVEPSFKVNSRRLGYTATPFRTSLYNRQFRRPFWQRRNRFWRPKRLSRIKFIDTRKFFLAAKKRFSRLALSYESAKKVNIKHINVKHPLKIIHNYFISFYNSNCRENFDTNMSSSSFEFNYNNIPRSVYAYTSYVKPVIVVPEMETLKPGTPEKPNVLPVDNMPTGSVRRIQRKKRKLEKKLFDPFYTEVAEDFYLLKELFFSKLVYKEKRWFSYKPFLKSPIKRYKSIMYKMYYLRRLTRTRFLKSLFKVSELRRYSFFKLKLKKIFDWSKPDKPKKRFKNRFKRMRKNIRGRGKKKKRYFSRQRRYFFRYSTSKASAYIRKLIYLSIRMSRYSYRSRDFIFSDIYLRYFRGHWAQRVYGYFHLNMKSHTNPYHKLSLNALSVLTLKNISNFKSRTDYINETRYMKRYHKLRYYKKIKIKPNTLCRVPGTFNFSLKKRVLTEKFENLFSAEKPKTRLNFFKKKKTRNFEKSYITCRKPFFRKTSPVRVKNLKLKDMFVNRSKLELMRDFPITPMTMFLMKKRLVAKKTATYFKQFYRYQRSTRVFPSILLVASLSRYALSVLNEAQCVGVSLVYFTDAAVSPLCNLFNVVMNSQINILSSMEVNINSIFNKAKVFNLISRVW